MYFLLSNVGQYVGPLHYVVYSALCGRAKIRPPSHRFHKSRCGVVNKLRAEEGRIKRNPANSLLGETTEEAPRCFAAQTGRSSP